MDSGYKGGAGRREAAADDAAAKLPLLRLRVAQPLSPQMDPQHANFIAGLQVGNFYIGERSLGSGPLKIRVLSVRDRLSEFAPLQKIWKRIRAKYYDFAVMIDGDETPLYLSIRSTAKGTAASTMINGHRHGKSAFVLTTEMREFNGHPYAEIVAKEVA